jgi:hypothetical protein
MENTEHTEPIRKAPPSNSRSHGWPKIADGEWWLIRDIPETTWSGDAYENNRYRVAARAWAKRHGFTVETRTARKGKELYMRFIKV